MKDTKSSAEWELENACIIVGRHIEGITLNAYEFLLDDDGYKRGFSSEEEAVAFLHSQGVTDE